MAKVPEVLCFFYFALFHLAFSSFFTIPTFPTFPTCPTFPYFSSLSRQIKKQSRRSRKPKEGRGLEKAWKSGGLPKVKKKKKITETKETVTRRTDIFMYKDFMKILI